MKTQLSICMISDDFLPAATGVGVYLKMVAPELAKRGHRVSVITTRRKGEPAVQKWEGLTIYRVFTIKMFDFNQALPTEKKIREIFAIEKPDIVHHHYASYLMMRACHVALSLKIPQASTFHFSAEVLTQPIPMRPFRELIRRTMVSFNNRMDMVIAPSKNLIKQIAAEGVHSEIRHITNPVVFSECTNVASIERTSGFTVLYAGRLGSEKNISYLIKSFAQVLKTNSDAILWIAGRGPEGHHL
jgi:1,2-diacylglycerol 3-alpha-glucosyltransferase